jgi:hypothetical protein
MKKIKPVICARKRITLASFSVRDTEQNLVTVEYSTGSIYFLEEGACEEKIKDLKLA